MVNTDSAHSRSLSVDIWDIRGNNDIPWMQEAGYDTTHKEKSLKLANELLYCMWSPAYVVFGG